MVAASPTTSTERLFQHISSGACESDNAMLVPSGVRVSWATKMIMVGEGKVLWESFVSQINPLHALMAERLILLDYLHQSLQSTIG